MRNDFESFILKYGSYFAIALIGASITTLFAKKKTAMKIIFGRFLSSLMIAYLIVNEGAVSINQSTLCWYVFAASLSSDYIIYALTGFGESIIKKFFNGGNQ